MHSIEAMRHEIASQPKELAVLRLQSPRGQGIMIGSGDSFVACTISALLSSGLLDYSLPTDFTTLSSARLMHGPSKVKNTIYFVSVSGRTSANILAAKWLKQHHYYTVAI